MWKIPTAETVVGRECKRRRKATKTCKAIILVCTRFNRIIQKGERVSLFGSYFHIALTGYFFFFFSVSFRISQPPLDPIGTFVKKGPTKRERNKKKCDEQHKRERTSDTFWRDLQRSLFPFSMPNRSTDAALG